MKVEVRYSDRHYLVDGDEIRNRTQNKKLKKGGDLYNKIMKKAKSGDVLERYPEKTIDSFPPVHMQDNQQIQEYQKVLEANLNNRQIAFCIEYISGEHRGSGTKSYAKAYEKDLSEDYDACSVGSSQLLKKKRILLYTELLMYKAGYSAESVDTNLLYIINQHSDLRAKLGAIKEFNKLQGRIKDRIEVHGEINHTASKPDYSNLSDEELEQLIRLLEKTKDTQDGSEPALKFPK